MVNQTPEWQAPEWLKKALEEYVEPPWLYSRTENTPALAGEIRFALADSGVAPVLVWRNSQTTTAMWNPVSDVTTEVPLPEPVVEVCLIDNDVDLATDEDYILAYEESGIPVKLLVISMVRGIVWERQLGPVQGRVEPELFERLTKADQEDDFSTIPWDKRGLPLLDRHDSRWSLRGEFVDKMQSLASDATSTVIGICDEYAG